MKLIDNIEKYRDKKPGPYQSKMGDLFGRFIIPYNNRTRLLIIYSSDGGWQHASVSVIKKKRCPTWEEMCFVKDLFWASDQAVMQLHPPLSDYVNNHAYCLHLWRPTNGEVIPMPPKEFV